MNYWVSRGGQQYGPYSLADLQKYVASGNILPTDLARNESMSQWLPVSQILAGGGGQAPQASTPQPPQPQQPQQPQISQPPQPQPYGQLGSQQPSYGQPANPQAYGQAPMYSQPGSMAPQPVVMAPQGGPMPPGMEWWLVLIIAILTCGIFAWVWMFIQANFVKQIRPACQALMFYALGIGGIFAVMLLFFVRSLVMLAPLLNIGCSIAIIVGHFQMKAAIEDYYNTTEPINLRLNGVMVFFFNVLYFQYHFARIKKWKTTGMWT
jgi:GYF domain 2/Domain of unknown function (DUF4234)